ncbi:MAG: alkaline phosphatase [Streptosporangiales bacterium]|nr:alkaline phosphatase [Streptosporangiales bacterium]
MLTVHGDRAGQADGHGQVARNVIYLQGDGMGLAHRNLIRLATVGQDDDLVMNELPVTGSVHTDAADPEEAVTDSAAAATAFATGHKTYNGAIGVDADGNRVETVLEMAKKAGKATGLVTTAQVTDASPAAFAAHVPDRGDQSEIARQYLDESRPDVILGGGEDWWYPKGEPGAWPDHPETDPTEESQGTKGNLVEKAKDLGYEYLTNADELREAEGDRLLGLFANEEMFEYHPEGEGDLYDPSVPLTDMTDQALQTLSRHRQGFFLMVEEEGIDGMAHANNAALTITSGQALDDTVATVLRFVQENPRTLVIVGGDHETGGLTIENVDGEDEGGSGQQQEDGPFTIAGSDLQFTVDWTTGGHTAADTPVTATGPGSARLDGTIDNTDVFWAMVKAMRL